SPRAHSSPLSVTTGGDCSESRRVRTCSRPRASSTGAYVTTRPPDPLGRLAYPEVWLLIVALPAVAYGITVGRIYPNGGSLPTLLWAGASAAAGAVSGLLGGFIFMRVRGLAALGAAEWAVCFVLAWELSSYGGLGHIDDDSGGLGLVIVVVFVVT